MKKNAYIWTEDNGFVIVGYIDKKTSWKSRTDCPDVLSHDWQALEHEGYEMNIGEPPADYTRPEFLRMHLEEE